MLRDVPLLARPLLPGLVVPDCLEAVARRRLVRRTTKTRERRSAPVRVASKPTQRGAARYAIRTVR